MFWSTDLTRAPFTWPEAQRAGIGRRQLDAAVRNREVRRVLRGVYVPADLADTIELRVAAAARVLSPHAVACDRTAAWLHGVDVRDYRDLDVVPPLESYTLRGHARTARPECGGGQRDLMPRDICAVDGLRVTTPLRTALDLGCKLSRRRAIAALDAFMRLHGVTVADMRRELPRYFRRRGVVQLRQLIPVADPRSESPGESRTRLAIVDAGLPAPEPQYWVVVDGWPTYRLDLAYPHARVAVEYDGREFHEGDEQRTADERRRAWLRENGWTVIVVTRDSFSPEAVDRWVGDLRDALRIAA